MSTSKRHKAKARRRFSLTTKRLLRDAGFQEIAFFAALNGLPLFKRIRAAMSLLIGRLQPCQC